MTDTIDAFLAAAAAHPGRPAVVEGKTITAYAALEERCAASRAYSRSVTRRAC